MRSLDDSSVKPDFEYWPLHEIYLPLKYPGNKSVTLARHISGRGPGDAQAVGGHPGDVCVSAGAGQPAGVTGESLDAQ